ncbi:MAG: beta-Ala-His dipeptidase, partial [Candidatus Thorarchaeota archaeon]
DVIHDFSKDPIKLNMEEIENQKWITADGTTLGADNAVGICYLLTLMNKIHKSELDFGSLGIDLLFTIDEEVGLKGAFNIDEDLIEGSFLINLDAEDEDAVTIGCAGGRVSFFQVKDERIEVNKNQDLIPIKIFISGLLGGHSGADIHLGRGNALKILGEILWKLNKKYYINLHSINGGNRTNAIPREANAIIYIKELNFSELKEFIQELILKIKRAYEHIEPTFQVLVERINNFTEVKIFKKRLQDKVLDILYTLPNGPISMHPQIKGLVFTSSNLAVVKTGKEIIEIKISQRSLSRYFKIALWEKTISLFELTGLNAEVKIDSDYPGWTPDFDSKILALCKDAYTELFSEEMKVRAIHAGLECGVLKKKFPNMEMVSIGPKIVGAHSPDERVSISSVEKIWTYLIKLLKKLF